MKLFPVFCFERCSGTKYENKKNTDFTEVSAFGVTSCSKISKFRNEKRPQLQSECFKIFNNYGGDENVVIKILSGKYFLQVPKISANLQKYSDFRCQHCPPSTKFLNHQVWHLKESTAFFQLSRNDDCKKQKRNDLINTF